MKFVLPCFRVFVRSVFLVCAVYSGNAASSDWDGNWPQAAGPNGSWAVPGGNAPVRWSVVRGEGIVWKTPLPEGGQGGIAVWKERLFLTTLKPEEGSKPNGREVVVYCLDARDGRVLWSDTLPGQATSVPAYFFSDATSPSPLTDGESVWFFNACGAIGCYDFTGKRKWLREWKPTGGRPFNKQFEPILWGDVLLNMEPRDLDDPKREPADPWNYIRGLDKQTGKTLWVSEDALTHYNTPVFGKLSDGTPALLQGRGAYHGVPESPSGLSLTSLAPGSEGRTLWRFQPAKGKAAYTQHWDANHALWIDSDSSEQTVIDSTSGRVLRTQSLTAKVDWRRFDPATGKYVLLSDIDLSKESPSLKVFPAQFCNILIGEWNWFLCYTEPGKHLGPPYCVGRVHVKTGKVEYLELPVSVEREAGRADRLIWGQPQISSTVNSRGVDIVSDKRSQGDGWWWGYLGSPTAVGANVYFTTMLGITYTLNTRAAVLDENALLSVNDLGVSGQTWSLNSLSYANGRIYHRSLKEVVCIGPRL
jgi:outer membrane protein assembly factor BamB